MIGLTKRQREVLDVIKRAIRKDGYPPSVRQLCGELGISINAVSDNLAALERKGAIVRSLRTARGIRVVE